MAFTPEPLFRREAFFSNKHICDSFSLKMFARQCKNIIESERNSDEEVVSFIRKAKNEISSSSSSDNEDAYDNGQLEEIFKKLAIEEKDELINTDCWFIEQYPVKQV